LNASGWAPAGLTVEYLRGLKMDKMPQQGIHAVTVPGAVDGWAKMHGKFGRLRWEQLFGAAVHYAEEGYPVPEILQAAWQRNRQQLDAHQESRRVFLPGGAAPAVSAVFRNPDLGRAMRLVARANGRDEFYRGAIAQAILATSAKLGGTMSAADLAEFSSEWAEPIHSTYRGWRVYELPPNGQGIAALQMLNVLEQFPAAPQGPHSAEELHKKIEAMKLAYADLRPRIGDPKFHKIPVAGMLSREYAQERARLIDPAKANCDAGPGQPMGSDTTYLAVVDREGNIASWIQSISAGFGSGVTVEGMGFLLHNRGGTGFELDAGLPRTLAPRKRPFHTIIPAFMERGDERIGFGIMGGPNQPLAHAQFVSHVADFGMNIQAALEAPRFTKKGPSGCDASIESRVGLETLRRLSALGHELEIRDAHSSAMGRGAAVLHNRKTGVNQGASDSRADGSAEPEPLPVR